MKATLNTPLYMQSNAATRQVVDLVRYPVVIGLSIAEQLAVRDGKLVWFKHQPQHREDSGFLIVTLIPPDMDSLIPKFFDGRPIFKFTVRQPAMIELLIISRMLDDES
jgi:hypothetical protein